MEIITVTELLKQFCVVMPTIIVGSQALTSALRGSFNIQSGKVAHILNWILGVITGVVFVVFKGLTFGLAPWVDLVIGGVCGLIGAGASNGLYDWEVVKGIFTKLADFFGNLIHGSKYYKNAEE